MANRRKKPNSPPDEPWIWLTRRMLESYAYQGLGINARRVLDFLMVEHMCHAGTENGRLLAPYKQLVKFGVAKSEICAAIDELEAFGFIDISRGMRLGGRSQASRYRLTWLLTAQGEPASDRWTKISKATVTAFRLERKRQKSLKRERKMWRRGLVALKAAKWGVPTQIL